MVCGQNLLLSLVKLGSVFPAFSGTSSLSGGCDSRSSLESLKHRNRSYFPFLNKKGMNDWQASPRAHLKAWTMTVPKRMKRAEKMRESSGIISRLGAKAAVSHTCWGLRLSQEENVPNQTPSHQETQSQARLFLG